MAGLQRSGRQLSAAEACGRLSPTHSANAMKRLPLLSACLLLLVLAGAHAQGAASASGPMTPEQAQRQMDEFLSRLPPEQQEKLRAAFKESQEARVRQHV